LLRYAIRADRWAKGYVTDASRWMVAFGVAELRLHRISAAIGSDNAASIAVVRKSGMQYDGRSAITSLPVTSRDTAAPSGRRVRARCRVAETR
jgi:RimJ/RimL family protein N-acetyltransferase